MIEHRTAPALEPLDPAIRQRSILIVLASAIVALLSPAYFAYVLWGQHQAPLFPLSGLPLIAALLLGAAACGVAALWRGLDNIARDLTDREDSEHEQIIIRVIAVNVVFAYGLVVITFAPGGAAAAACLILGIGLLVSWLLLLNLLIQPGRSYGRRYIAMLADVGFLSAYLHFGGGFAAAWYGFYLWVSIGNGLRYGVKPLFYSIIAGVVGFSAVIATTPYWYERLPLSA